jgi:hypothetical protein
MLYKVTPMMPAPTAPARKAREPGQPRKRRKSAIYDAEGNEVLITLMCLKCKGMKPLAQFGLRKMADGAIRNQPWCRGCRGAAGTKKKVEQPASVEAAAPLSSIVPAPLLIAAEPVVSLELAAPGTSARAEVPVFRDETPLGLP